MRSPAVCLAGLALCAAAAAATTARAQGPEPGLQGRSDVLISIRHRGGEEGGVVRGVELDGEAASEESARAFGFRSMHQVLDVDCGARRERVAEMTVYDQHEQHGRSRARRPPGQWALPSADAYLADVITAVCRGGAAAAPRQVARAAPALARLLTEASPPAAARRPDPPQEEPPPKLAMAPRSPPAAAPRPGAPSIRVASRPAPALPMAAVALVTGPTEPTRRGAPERGWVAQIGASSSPESARSALGKVSGLMASGLGGRVEEATVRGQRVYRATVGGFGSYAAANAFCAKVERTGGACWAR
jgi:hypothetical protein